MELISLSHIQPGQSGTVTQINGKGLVFQRLRAMGVRLGINISVVKTAPLGDPLEICIKGNCRMALRKSEAQQIMISR